MPTVVLCAITDDERRDDVVATGRALARSAGLRALFAHVAEAVPPTAMAVDFAPGISAPHPAAHLPGGSERDPTADARERGRRLLDEMAGIADDEAVVAVGDPVTELDRLAVEHDAGVVVVGASGKGALSSALLGSVSRALARGGSRPVLIARHDVLPTTGGPVVAAVDIAEEDFATPAVQAAKLATALGRPLVLVHVVGRERLPAVAGPVPVPVALEAGRHDVEAAERTLRELAAELGADDIECLAVDARSIAQRLDEFASGRRADLLVVGCRGCGILRTALEGSVSLDLVRHGSRPLVVVPPG